MDEKIIVEIIEKAKPYIIPEKMGCFKSILIKQALDNEFILDSFSKSLDYIKELDESDVDKFTTKFLKGLFYLKKTTLTLICALVANFSKKGVEFLDSIDKKMNLPQEQKGALIEFKNKIKRTNELIDLGYNFLEAENLARFPLYILTIDKRERIPLIKSTNYKADGVSEDGEEVIYEEVASRTSNKTYFLAFFIKNSSYLRYIGEVGSNLVYVTNEKGTFAEIQEKNFTVLPCKTEEENDILAKNPYFMPKTNPNAKSLDVDQEFLLSVIDEINELKSYNGNTFVLEDLLANKIKQYELK